MKIGVLRTRVARRIVLLFFLCALLPVGGLAVVSYFHVRGQLHEQSRERLEQVTKAAGMAVVERLLFVDEQLRLLSGRLDGTSGPGLRRVEAGTVDGSLRGVAELGVTSIGGRGNAPPALVEALGSLDPERTSHLEGGGTVLLTPGGRTAGTQVFLVRPVDPDAPDAELLWARADSSHLWGAAQIYADLPTGSGLCVVDEMREPLFCSVSGVGSFLAELGTASASDPNSGGFIWTDAQGDEQRARYWSVFLEGTFKSRPWRVVTTESVRAASAPIEGFRTAFGLVIVGSLCVVVLLSNVQIRRNLDPLAKLKEGTVRISKGDFGSRVRVESGDEFEELAASFNRMARDLRAQFSALSTISEIDRAVLSALDTETIVDTILERIDDLIPCDRVAVCLLDSAGGNGEGDRREGRVYALDVDAPAAERSTRSVVLEGEELGRLRDVPHHWNVEDGSPVPEYLTARSGDPGSFESGVLLPMLVGGEPVGVLALFSDDGSEISREAVARVRQIADQVAVALSNAHLIRDLDDLTWGSLTALARTIDAKSPWTAGHSERVRDLAVRIGEELGLEEDELDLLHTGALLHDIGKLGIPPEVLDKPGPLTPEEMELMRSHVRVGVRILEPVRAFQRVLPMVLHHHENFDGTGYPEGLAGDEIPLRVRILTLSDCFDAVTSRRPYRSAMEPEEAMRFVREQSGQMFDPEIVAAFESMMDSAALLRVAEAGVGE